MKSVYPEVIRLRYANIPKATMQGHCSGTHLIIDMSLCDSAAEPASTLKAASDAPLQSALSSLASKPLDQELSSSTGGPAAAHMTPSSTQAAIKAVGHVGAVSALCRGQQSVNKASGAVDEEVGTEGQAVESPGEPSRMMAIKAEFERRLENQVGSLKAALGLLCQGAHVASVLLHAGDDVQLAAGLRHLRLFMVLHNKSSCILQQVCIAACHWLMASCVQ